ncbi:TetR/AcrR family transcriptional regulator [Spirillospora sp. CA-128828]|uniref:TetR/AcrR family transcriptional regulator n=1 Tax=Spirillospora sp. CA-128828 TaxID=3240033 RepID=UPI003D8F941A
MADDTPGRPVRRPRMTAEREIELLVAALDELREVGYEALTMDAVAARGRCSKATLYRQWQSKPQMIAAALYATRPVDAGEIDTGTLRGDLLALGGELAAHAEKDTALFAALAHASLTDRALASAVRTTLLEPETAHLATFIERAIRRGELAASPDAIAFVPHLVFSVLVSRPLFEDAYADPEYLTRFIDQVILPVLQHG